MAEYDNAQVAMDLGDSKEYAEQQQQANLDQAKLMRIAIAKLKEEAK
jgi:hypothetical protein